MSRAISGPHTDGTVCVHFSLTAHPVLNPGTLVLGQLLTAGGNSTEWPVQLGMAGWVLPGPGPRMGGACQGYSRRPPPSPPEGANWEPGGGRCVGTHRSRVRMSSSCSPGKGQANYRHMGRLPLRPFPGLTPTTQCPACGARGEPAPSGRWRNGALERSHWTHVVPGEQSRQQGQAWTSASRPASLHVAALHRDPSSATVQGS